MINVLVTIYDKVADTYTAPLCFTNTESAKRYFKTKMANNPNATDFELYYIADYDAETSVITGLAKKLIDKGE